MDSSRDDDLARLYQIFSDPFQDEATRRNAHRSFQNIQKQVKDRKLTALRHHLIHAVQIGDEKSVENLEQTIHEYSWRKGYNKPTRA